MFGMVDMEFRSWPWKWVREVKVRAAGAIIPTLMSSTPNLTQEPRRSQWESPKPLLCGTDLSSSLSHTKALPAQHPRSSLISPNLTAQVRTGPGPRVLVIFRISSQTPALWGPAVPSKGKACGFLLKGCCIFPSEKTS